MEAACCGCFSSSVAVKKRKQRKTNKPIKKMVDLKEVPTSSPRLRNRDTRSIDPAISTTRNVDQSMRQIGSGLW